MMTVSFKLSNCVSHRSVESLCKELQQKVEKFSLLPDQQIFRVDIGVEVSLTPLIPQVEPME